MFELNLRAWDSFPAELESEWSQELVVLHVVSTVSVCFCFFTVLINDACDVFQVARSNQQSEGNMELLCLVAGYCPQTLPVYACSRKFGNVDLLEFWQSVQLHCTERSFLLSDALCFSSLTRRFVAGGVTTRGRTCDVWNATLESADRDFGFCLS